MGDNTTASGNFTTAMGRNASTNGLSGSFVYGDATTSGIVNATAANSFTVWLPTLTVPAYRLRQHRQSTGQGRARSA